MLRSCSCWLLAVTSWTQPLFKDKACESSNAKQNKTKRKKIVTFALQAFDKRIFFRTGNVKCWLGEGQSDRRVGWEAGIMETKCAAEILWNILLQFWNIYMAHWSFTVIGMAPKCKEIVWKQSKFGSLKTVNTFCSAELPVIQRSKGAQITFLSDY